MGRAKLRMEYIPKEKPRNTAFKKRKEGLIRKLREFTTLCDVKACMVIAGGGSNVLETWPASREEVGKMIEIYKSKKKDSGTEIKTAGLSGFFQDRIRKTEEELAKIRKNQYPTWMPLLDAVPEDQLREFAAGLGNKLDELRFRIELLRRNQECCTRMDTNLLYVPAPPTEIQDQQPAGMYDYGSIMNGCNSMEIQDQQPAGMYDYGSMMNDYDSMMIAMNGNPQMQFGTAPTGLGDTQYPFGRDIPYPWDFFK